MKNYHVLAVCVVVLFSNFAVAKPQAKRELAATMDSKVKFSGHMRIRTEILENKSKLLKSAFNKTLLRARPAATITVLDNLRGKIEPQFSRTFGDSALSGGVADPNYFVHQAYIDYEPVHWLQFMGGRFEASYGDQLLISPLGWHNVGRSFDGFRFRFKYGLGWSDVFYSKLNTNETAAGNAVPTDDSDLYTLYNGWNLGKFAKSFDFYLIFLRNGASAIATRRVTTAGARIKSKVGAVDYRGEYSIQRTRTGNTAIKTSSADHQLNLEAGHTFGMFSSPRLAAQYFFATKYFNHLMPLGHAYLGFADVFGRSNIWGLAFHLMNKWTDKLSSRVDFHWFRRVNTLVNAAKASPGISGLMTRYASTSQSRDLGNEIDFTLKYKIEKPLTLALGVSLFSPGDYFSDANLGDQLLFYYGQLLFKF